MPDTFRAKVSIGDLQIELEGSEQFVRDELKFVKENLISKINVAGMTNPTIRTPPKEKTIGEKTPIKEFVKGKSVRSDMERAAIIAYYLATNEAAEEIDGDTISASFTEAGWRPPKNSAATLHDAKRRKRYFDGGKGGKYKLSDAGRYFVEHEWGSVSMT